MVTFPTMSMMNGLRGRDKGTVLLSFYSCSTRPNTFQSITFLPFFLSSPSSSLRFLLLFFLFSYSLSLFLTFFSSSSSSSISMNTKSCSSTASFGYSLRFYEFPIADSLPVSMNVINCLQHLFSGFSFSFSFFYISRLFDIICWFIHFKYEIDDFWKKNGSYRQYFSLLYCIRF